jgi:hypothetical protein
MLSSLPFVARSLLLLIGASVCLLYGSRTAIAQDRLFLLTPGEAAQLRLGIEDRMPGVTLRGLPQGPRVVVREPSVRNTADGPVIETTPSTKFVISFQPNRAPVDMDSLEIKARKGVFSLSLTPRLKPYIKGTSLEADTVTIPEGRFMVQIEIVDTAGAKTVETYRLEVRRVGAHVAE